VGRGCGFKEKTEEEIVIRLIFSGEILGKN